MEGLHQMRGEAVSRAIVVGDEVMGEWASCFFAHWIWTSEGILGKSRYVVCLQRRTS